MNFPFDLASGLARGEFPSFTNTTHSSPSAYKIDQLIEENNQLLLLSLEALAGKLDQPDVEIMPAVPYLQKLQKNLLHLALLAEQANPSPLAQPVVNAPVQGWTNVDLQKLKELLFTVGEDPMKLSLILGKPVEVVNMMLHHLKQSHRSLCCDIIPVCNTNNNIKNNFS